MPYRLLRQLAAWVWLATSAIAQAADITVSAASSLTNALRDLAPAFEAAHPGQKLQFNFGASGALLQQIAKGAPADVFVSADQESMDQAQAQGLVQAAQLILQPVHRLVLVLVAQGQAEPLILMRVMAAWCPASAERLSFQLEIRHKQQMLAVQPQCRLVMVLRAVH